MRIHGKKRLLIAAGTLTTVGAVATLVAGVTFGLFSATTPTQTGTFTAGTVTLSQPAVITCTASNVVPGDSTSGYATGSKAKGQCTFTVSYQGTAPADLGLDLAIASTAPGSPVQAYAPGNLGVTPPAALGLYDGTSNGLQMLVKDSTTTYMSGTTWNGAVTASGAAPALADLAITAAPVTSGTWTFTVDWGLPLVGADNAYQNAGSSITLIVHAVQAGNNGTGVCTAGLTCANVTNWS